MENLEENVITNINEVVELLKSKVILYSIIGKEKCYFFGKDDKIIIYNPNSKYNLSYKDFVELYGKNIFVIYESNEQQFDFSRDDEYYSWKHK